MIWFYLAGFISGAVGMILFLQWWIRKRAIRVTPEQMIRDIERTMEERDSQ